MRSFNVGLDASRNRSGGARAHIAGLLSGSDPRDYGIEIVHLWAHDSLNEQVADQPWLVKHDVPELRGSIAKQLWWQYAKLPRIVDGIGCDILFNTDAGSVCPLSRSATLSQNMLPFEPREMQRYGISRARLRLEILKRIQSRCLKRAKLAIFLTNYAQQTVQQTTGPIANSVVIPHGIDERFRAVADKRRNWPAEAPIRCLYVSNAAPYKHQWHVIEAIAILRNKGHNLELTLVGGSSGPARALLENALMRFDRKGDFVSHEDFVPNDSIPDYLARSDLFIFASSCENLPITMLEAMASGIPVCCSNRGPMPEVLGGQGCFFDPEDPVSIANAVESMIEDEAMRALQAAKSLERSKAYTWRRSSEGTWKALVLACEADTQAISRNRPQSQPVRAPRMTA